MEEAMRGIIGINDADGTPGRFGETLGSLALQMRFNRHGPKGRE
jgi:hypothetical protein